MHQNPIEGDQECPLSSHLTGSGISSVAALWSTLMCRFYPEAEIAIQVSSSLCDGYGGQMVSALNSDLDASSNSGLCHCFVFSLGVHQILENSSTITQSSLAEFWWAESVLFRFGNLSHHSPATAFLNENPAWLRHWNFTVFVSTQKEVEPGKAFLLMMEDLYWTNSLSKDICKSFGCFVLQKPS